MGVGRMPNVGLLLFRALHPNCAPHPGWTNEQPWGGGRVPSVTVFTRNSGFG